MVAVLLRLKLSLLRNGLRRSVWKLVGLVLGGLYGLGVVVMAVIGLTSLRFAGVQIASSVTVIAFSALTIGWLVFSLLVFGVDETVDPARFALLPVPARRLAPGLLLSAVVGLPGLATVVVALGLIGTWSIDVLPLLATLVAIPIGVVLCVLWTRAVTGLLAQVLASRRFRDVAIVVLTLFFVGIGLLSSVIGNAASRDPQALLRLLHRGGEVLGWTPFGWIWVLPGAVAQGQWRGAGLRLVLALALVVLLWRVWVRVLERNLTSPLESGAQSKAVRSTSKLAELMPATPAGAVALRCLRYWRRDPRYLAALVSLIVLPVVILGTQLLAPARSTTVMALTPVLIGFMMAPSMAADLAYDGTAVSAHVLSGMRGRDDRAGRVLSAMIILTPVIVLALVACTVVSGRLDLLPITLALTTTFMLSGLGIAMWAGVIFPGKAPPPGANPFSSSGSGGLPALISFAVSSGLTLAVGLPTIALVVASFWVDWLEWVALVVGVAIGVLVLRLGITRGGALLDRRWPEVLARVEAVA